MRALFKNLDVRTLKFSLGLLWNASPTRATLLTVLLALQAIIPILILYQVKLLFDAVSVLMTSLVGVTLPSTILLHLGWIIGLSISNIILNSATTLVREQHHRLISEAVVNILQKKSSEIDLAQYDDPEYYDILYRTQTDTPRRLLSLFNHSQSIFLNTVSLIGLFGMLLFVHWLTGLVIFLSIIPGVVNQFEYSRELHQCEQRNTSSQRKEFYYNWMLTSRNFAKELRTLDLANLFQEKSMSIRRSLFDDKYWLLKNHTKHALYFKVIETLAVYGLFLFLILRSLKGFISLGSLVMYYQLFNRSQSSIRTVLTDMTGIYEDMLFLKNLIHFLGLKLTIKDPQSPVDFPKEIQRLDFKNVTFHYSNQAHPAISNINLSVHPGEKIAIIGRNGSGKTTLIKLLCRLYDPTQGNIEINGIDHRLLKVTELRRRISVLFQDHMYYQLKAGENIWLGDTTLAIDHNRIRDVSMNIGAHEFIEKFPLQYNTVLGKMFEKGEELSTGQWQKIALARALFRDAAVVILDEPSSALDAEAERQIFDHIASISSNKIMILISHRLLTIKSVSRIYLLEDGQIVEHGSHNDLMNLNGKYAALFNRQYSDWIQ